MILTVVMTTAALVWFAFLGWYTIRAKWWRLPVGRNTFGVSLVLFLILLRATVLRWFPEFQQHDVAGIIVYGLAVALGIQRLIYMEKAQREHELPH